MDVYIDRLGITLWINDRRLRGHSRFRFGECAAARYFRNRIRNAFELCCRWVDISCCSDLIFCVLARPIYDDA
jgi:hypothetical protein